MSTGADAQHNISYETKVNQMPPQAKNSRPEKLALDEFLPYRLSVVAEAVSTLLAKGYERQFGITIAEWRVLAVIGEYGKQTTQEVIDRTRMDRVRVSRAVIRLADKGLIDRTANPADARAQILDFSGNGLATYRKIVPFARSIQSKLAASLSSEEIRQIDVILGKLDACARMFDQDTKT